MKLYELAENYNELLEILDNEEATAEELADTLDGINDAIEVKVDNICRVRKYLEGKVEVYKAEAKRLTNASSRKWKKKMRFDSKLNLKRLLWTSSILMPTAF